MDGNHSLLTVDYPLVVCDQTTIPFIIFIIFGFPVNVYVVWLILAGSGDKGADITSLNQALCEVVNCMATAMLLIAENHFRLNFAFLNIPLYLVGLSLGFLISARPLFMSCVCLERYLAVVHPVTFLKFKLLRYRVAGSIISWLTVLTFSVLPLLIPHPAIFYFVSFAMLFTCFLLQSFCCAETIYALVKPGPGERNQDMSEMNSAKLKALQIIIIIMLGGAAVHLPHFMSVIFVTQSLEEEGSICLCISIYMNLITGFIPPLLYLNRIGKLLSCFRMVT